MRWTNKGHELDFIGSRFENVDRIFLYGAGEMGAEALRGFYFLDCPITFIDRSVEKQQSGFMGKPVISPSEFLNNKDKYLNSIVIVTMNDNFRIKRTLLTYGFTEGTNLFEYGWFFNYYLPIFALYREDKLYMCRTGIVVTNVCTLKCKYCVQNLDIMESFKHRNLQEILDEIDAIFHTFDFMDTFMIVGGEASTHPDIKSILRYLIDNYGSKFRICVIPTNGLFAYDDEYIEILKNPDIYLEWTDYTDNLDEKKKAKIHDNMNYFRASNINVIYQKHDLWVDFGKGELLSYSDDELTERFHSCAVCNTVRNKLLPCCSKAYEIEEDFLGGGGEGDCLPLSGCTVGERWKYTLLELTFGFTENGFPNACRFCKGHYGVNNDMVTAGVQV